MKYVIGAGVFVALALVAKFLVLLRFGVDIYVHDTYLDRFAKLHSGV